ncbi:tail fiber assembly protein [Morganella morganii]|uniref:tail fiber assembly protein n=1 Tax=Morganella morganii TaxID=582 RepID=UPI002115C47F|nr:tail fiber assembly protein [Morganella morganii]
MINGTVKKWVTDKAEQKASEIAAAEGQKQLLLAEAEQVIAMLERKIRLNMATDEDKAKLNEWEIYSVKMSDVDTSTAPDITWQVKP